jgi:hypothetical protein
MLQPKVRRQQPLPDALLLDQFPPTQCPTQQRLSSKPPLQYQEHPEERIVQPQAKLRMLARFGVPSSVLYGQTQELLQRHQPLSLLLLLLLLLPETHPQRPPSGEQWQVPSDYLTVSDLNKAGSLCGDSSMELCLARSYVSKAPVRVSSRRSSFSKSNEAPAVVVFDFVCHTIARGPGPLHPSHA